MSNEHLAFGIDISRYQYSPDGSVMMDFREAALHRDPFITFVASRAGISWGYQDPWFMRNWTETRMMDEYRKEAGLKAFPVGRLAYHVLYPSQSPISQADNLFRIVGDAANWDHDIIVMDNELDQGQTKRTITDCIKAFAEICLQRTGMYPINYSRTGWMNAYTYTMELAFLDNWLAQYRYSLPYPMYTPEYPAPPDPLPQGHDEWLIIQSAMRGKSIGSKAMHYMDYNRWNGDEKDVAKYCNFADIVQPPQHDLAWLIEIHENTELHPPLT